MIMLHREIASAIVERKYGWCFFAESNTKACPITNQYQTIVQCNPVTIQWSELGFDIVNNAS